MLPGLWSLIKRAPVSKIVRKKYAVAGAGTENGRQAEEWARMIYKYFVNKNYTPGELGGEVIEFYGRFGASVSQGLSLVLYTFFCKFGGRGRGYKWMFVVWMW